MSFDKFSLNEVNSSPCRITKLKLMRKCGGRYWLCVEDPYSVGISNNHTCIERTYRIAVESDVIHAEKWLLCDMPCKKYGCRVWIRARTTDPDLRCSPDNTREHAYVYFTDPNFAQKNIACFVESVAGKLSSIKIRVSNSQFYLNI